MDLGEFTWNADPAGKMEAEDRRLVHTMEEEPKQGTEEEPPGRAEKKLSVKQGRVTG